MQSAKSWSGGASLPPISASGQGRDTKSAAGGLKHAPLPKRPATMPGNLGGGGRHIEEEE